VHPIAKWLSLTRVITEVCIEMRSGFSKFSLISIDVFVNPKYCNYSSSLTGYIPIINFEKLGLRILPWLHFNLENFIINATDISGDQ
jgi:hypothetical protein